MERYYPYDVFSTERIEETATIEDGLIQLRHTPKYRSVVIDGFEETDSISLPLNHFRVDYSLDTYYRESNRLLHFNPENNGKELTISYIACGTVITADDMNEIKAHLESDHSKYYQLPIASHDIRGGVRIGKGLYMTGDILNVSGSSGGSSDYTLPIASANQLGGVKIGKGLSMDGDTLNASGGEGIGYFKDFTRESITIYCFDERNIGDEYWTLDSEAGQILDAGFESNFGRAPAIGDVIEWYIPGNDIGHAVRANDKWFNLGCFGSYGWQDINPLLTIADRKKLDNLPNGLVLGEGLAFDEDGKLCVVKEKNPDGWAYQDSGYDVIPAAPLIYVDETHFYQPEWNARMNDMFNTPEGIMEFWIRCDLTCAGLAYGHRFGFGYCSKTSGTFVGMMNGNSASSGNANFNYVNFALVASETTGGRTNLTFNTNGGNHILFHAVSHPTEGYREITINYGTYRVSGNVNGGNPFDSFFVYSNSEHALFSNFVVSSTQLEY